MIPSYKTQSLPALNGPLSLLQLPSYLSQEKACQQTSVHEEEEAAGDAGHAAATEEVEPSHRGNVQGGPPGHAPTEPPSGPVSAAAGAYDESPGKDDPAFLRCVSIVGSEWRQRSGEAVKCEGCGLVSPLSSLEKK